MGQGSPRAGCADAGRARPAWGLRPNWEQHPLESTPPVLPPLACHIPGPFPLIHHHPTHLYAHNVRGPEPRNKPKRGWGWGGVGAESTQQDPLRCAGIARDRLGCRTFKASRLLRVNIFSGDIRGGLEGFDPGHALAQDCADGRKATGSVLEQKASDAVRS